MARILVRGRCAWKGEKGGARLVDGVLDVPLAHRTVQAQGDGTLALVTDSAGRVALPAGRWRMVFDGDSLYEGCEGSVVVPSAVRSHIPVVAGLMALVLGVAALVVVLRRMRGRRGGTSLMDSVVRSTLVRSVLFRKGALLAVMDERGAPVGGLTVLVVPRQGEPWKGRTDGTGRVRIPDQLLPATAFLFTPEELVLSRELPSGATSVKVTLPSRPRLALESFFTLLELMGVDDPRTVTPAEALKNGAIGRQLARYVDRCSFGHRCEGDAGHLANYLKSLINSKIAKKDR